MPMLPIPRELHLNRMSITSILGSLSSASLTASVSPPYSPPSWTSYFQTLLVKGRLIGKAKHAEKAYALRDPLIKTRTAVVFNSIDDDIGVIH